MWHIVYLDFRLWFLSHLQSVQALHFRLAITLVERKRTLTW